MFYGQNCSGRLGEKRCVISVVGSKNDFDFNKFLNELNLKNIKRDLNQKYFLKAVELAKKFNLHISLTPIPSEKYGNWKRNIKDYSNWFEKLYGIICFKTIEPIIDKKIILHMDREYDQRTMEVSSNIVCLMIKNIGINIPSDTVYIRKEKEYPTNKIVIADLFARGFYKGYNCESFIINKNLEIQNEFEILEKSAKDKPSKGLYQ